MTKITITTATPDYVTMHLYQDLSGYSLIARIVMQFHSSIFHDLLFNICYIIKFELL